MSRNQENGWQEELGRALAEHLGPVESRRLAMFFLAHPEKAVAAHDRLAAAKRAGGSDSATIAELADEFRRATMVGDA